jgi:N6-adenosine-specific RNA methylase IME4
MNKLAVLSFVERRLASVQTVDEAKEIRDQAEAIRVYAKSARKGLAIQNRAAAIKILAEQRAGTLLAEREKSVGGRGKKTAFSLKGVLGTETEHGASAIAHRWQVMAGVPEERVRELEAELTTAGKELTSALILRQAAPVPKAIESIPPPTGAYRTFVVDPPWPMEKIERDVRPMQAGFDYPTMDEDSLMAWAHENLIPCVDPDSGAHLYLWTTHKHLPMALRLAAAWGFNYECLMTWVKNVGFTPFSWMRSTEHVIFARRGGLPLQTMGLRLDFQADVRQHSRKPDVFYERVAAASPGPRLDMFARERHEGFDNWGNEADLFESLAD